MENIYLEKPMRIFKEGTTEHYAISSNDDCFVINTEDDTYFCYPLQKDVISKMAFATEEIYLYNLNKAKK
mgnify:CR=1 FL=1